MSAQAQTALCRIRRHIYHRARGSPQRRSDETVPLKIADQPLRCAVDADVDAYDPGLTSLP